MNACTSGRLTIWHLKYSPPAGTSSDIWNDAVTRLPASAPPSSPAVEDEDDFDDEQPAATARDRKDARTKGVERIEPHDGIRRPTATSRRCLDRTFTTACR